MFTQFGTASTTYHCLNLLLEVRSSAHCSTRVGPEVHSVGSLQATHSEVSLVRVDFNGIIGRRSAQHEPLEHGTIRGDEEDLVFLE